jgi:hypothetical protein
METFGLRRVAQRGKPRRIAHADLRSRHDCRFWNDRRASTGPAVSRAQPKGSQTNRCRMMRIGIKIRNSGESGYVSDQEKPGASAHAPVNRRIRTATRQRRARATPAIRKLAANPASGTPQNDVVHALGRMKLRRYGWSSKRIKLPHPLTGNLSTAPICWNLFRAFALGARSQENQDDAE